MHVKDHVIHVSLVDYGNTKLIQHALKVSRLFKLLKLDTIWKMKETNPRHVDEELEDKGWEARQVLGQLRAAENGVFKIL